MAEAEEGAGGPGGGEPQPGDKPDAGTAAEAGAAGETEEAPAVPAGPGPIRRAVSWLIKWHSFFFLGISLALAVAAVAVYPRQEERIIPPADSFYRMGVDRLFRVLNPDLPLLSATPTDEALAARNAFLNLFIFYRQSLGASPRFINPHLLAAEANRILAENDPALRDKYYREAAEAYTDAALWENREDAADRIAAYAKANFLDPGIDGDPEPGGMMDFFTEHEPEITLRRARRLDYISYRQAETNLRLGRPEDARAPLEAIQNASDAHRREALRLIASDDPDGNDAPRRPFELGPDEYTWLDYLLGRAYDELNDADKAKAAYRRYLAAVPDSREHAPILERLAGIAMNEGEVYFRADPARSTAAFQTAADYYADVSASPSTTTEQRNAAVFGAARANSRLADLAPAVPPGASDAAAAAGRILGGWLEEFSGQPLPARTLAIPLALGEVLARPELILPEPLALPLAVAGSFGVMAGGAMETPGETHRRRLRLALENYDHAAAVAAGAPAGDSAALRAAWECLRLGRGEEARARFERMLDPLADDEVKLAARIGLATIALDEGDPAKAGMLLLGGYAHAGPIRFSPSDADWFRLIPAIGNPATRLGSPGIAQLWEMLPENGRQIASYAASGRRPDAESVNRFLRAMNTAARRRDFYRAESFPAGERNFYLSFLLARDPERLTDADVAWRNRLLIEETWPYDLARRGSRDNIGFPPLPPARLLPPGGLVQPGQALRAVLGLAAAWTAKAGAETNAEDRLRMILNAVDARKAALDDFNGDPGEILYDLATDYEALADIREGQGDHRLALSLTAEAARSYFDVSLRSRGAAREMDALLAAGDAFFRAGLLERAIESQRRFLDRFGYVSPPGGEASTQVVRVENLLGRASWFLGDTENAIAAFTRNIPRRTPDRYKSMYYIGRVLMEEGVSRSQPALLGSPDAPLPPLDRNGDPVISTALQAFNHLRQNPGINPSARAWRWSAFDLGALKYEMAERARAEWEQAPAGEAAGQQPEVRIMSWLPLYDEARMNLTEALDRYPLRRNGSGSDGGVSIRVEPEDYADVMAARLETEYTLSKTLLTLAEARGDESLFALARTHLANLGDRGRYASALFDPALDRFQLNGAVIREEIDGGTWDRSSPLPRTRLGDDEGPTHSPRRLRDMLRNSVQLLAAECFRAGDLAAAREGGAAAAAGFYRQAYNAHQDLYDRFGAPFGSLAMLGMGDALARMGRPDDAANHYRMAENIARLQPADTRSDDLLDIGPAFWARRAADRLEDRAGGYRLP